MLRVVTRLTASLLFRVNHKVEFNGGTNSFCVYMKFTCVLWAYRDSGSGDGFWPSTSDPHHFISNVFPDPLLCGGPSDSVTGRKGQEQNRSSKVLLFHLMMQTSLSTSCPNTFKNKDKIAIDNSRYCRVFSIKFTWEITKLNILTVYTHIILISYASSLGLTSLLWGDVK